MIWTVKDDQLSYIKLPELIANNKTVINDKCLKWEVIEA